MLRRARFFAASFRVMIGVESIASYEELYLLRERVCDAIPDASLDMEGKLDDPDYVGGTERRRPAALRAA